MTKRFVWGYDPGMGKPFTGKGGMVTISSRVGDRIVKRRVTVAPVFDPNATTMVPIPGWRAASIPARKAA